MTPPTTKPEPHLLSEAPIKQRCTAIVKDARSKNVGKRCSRWRIPDSKFCSAHDPSHKPQHAAGVARGKKALERIKQRVADAAPIAPVDTDVEPESEVERLWLLQAQALADRKAELERLRSFPPDLTPEQEAAGLVYKKQEVDTHHGHSAPPGVDALVDARGHLFYWRLITKELALIHGTPTDGGYDEYAEEADEYAARVMKVRRMRALGVDERRISAFMETGSIYGSDRDPRLGPEPGDLVPLADQTLDGERLPERLD